MYRALLLTTALAAINLTPARGQITAATADTTLLKKELDDYDRRFRYSVLVDPFALYSRTYGFGLAAHVTADNLLWEGSQWRISARPSQRRQIYWMTLKTHGRTKKDVYGLFRALYENNDAYRYYGIGQSSLLANGLSIDKDYFEAVARVGFEFFNDHLTIQPMVGYLWNNASYEETDDSTFANLDQRSQEALLYAIGRPTPDYDDPDNVHQGVRFGANVALDYRDRKAYPRAGYLINGSWSRYQSVTDQDVVFDRVNAGIHGFIGLGGDHVLTFRTIVQSTTESGDEPMPFYLFPKLDFNLLGGLRNQRHVNFDLVNATAEYRWSFLNLLDLYQISGWASAGVGGVYNDIWEDFEFDVTFAKDLPEGSVALRPGFGVGLRVSGLEQEHDYITWLLGFGPEGLTLMTFRFVFEIGDIR